MDDDNEYLNTCEIIFYGLKMIGILPFISFRKAKRKPIYHQLLTLVSLVFYSIAFGNEVRFVYKTTTLLFRQFNFFYFVAIFPITLNRLYIICIPIMGWNRCSDVHNFWNHWMRHQKQLEKMTKTPYQSPVKAKIRWVSAVGILTTVLITSNQNNFESVYYVIIRTGVSSFGFIMVLLEMMPLLWYINCIYIESVSKTINYLVQKSIRSSSHRNILSLTNLWIDLCDLSVEFNRSFSALYLAYVLLLISSLINAPFFTFHLYMVEHNEKVGWTYLLPTLICVINTFILYESANAASKQITAQTGELILKYNMINMNGRMLRSLVYFLEIIEYKNPELNFSGLLTLNRSKIISLYAIIVYYLIVLKQFSTVK